MTPRLFVRDEAAADIEDTTAWCEEQRRGLGGEFARALRAALAGVARHPHPLTSEDVAIGSGMATFFGVVMGHTWFAPEKGTRAARKRRRSRRRRRAT